MARKRTWYKKYIGYQFGDGGVLMDVFYFEDEKGRPTGTGYEVYYPDTDTWHIKDYAAFMDMVKCTDLPK